MERERNEEVSATAHFANYAPMLRKREIFFRISVFSSGSKRNSELFFDAHPALDNIQTEREHKGPTMEHTMSTTANSSKNVLNSDVEIKGNLKFSGELTFEGKLEGEIN